MAATRTEVVIVGAGPAGMIVALELGRRGVSCMLLDAEPAPPRFPKANATTSRTMEHYRRLGFADKVRALGLPEDYPQDIAYFTRFTRHELARLEGRSRGEAARAREGADSRWPTPEPLHRAQQMLIEPVIAGELARWPSIEVRRGWRASRLLHDSAGASVEAEPLAGGAAARIDCDYVVGADGARSMVREVLGIRYEGQAGEQRDFLGGRMCAVYLRAAGLYRIIRAGRSWQYWAVNREQRGVLCAIDGRETFVLHVQLPRGVPASVEFARAAVQATAGATFDCEIAGVGEWTAGHALVAGRFGAGRVFLAGDCAHLFTPTGGQGYNTAVDDASNLGWKLAAVCRGWGGSALLASYESERKPIARRNTAFARAMADSIGRMAIPAALEDDTAQGAEARAQLGRELLDHCRREFDIPGIHFGAFYGGSPIVAGDGSPSPRDDWHAYTPGAVPGARAPHVWLDDGVSIFDRFGRDFSLLRFDRALDASALAAAAERAGVPLALLDVDSEEARDLYARDLVLVRPDHHVAWRGNAPPPDPAALLAAVTGGARIDRPAPRGS